MNFYTLIRPLLFQLKPETAHHLTLASLSWWDRLGLLKKPLSNAPPVQAMGIDFPNPIGLAAGLDKNGDYINALATLGFGFIEIGTITPRAQSGNPRPRLFRLQKNQALINRMGFNNKGVDYLIDRVKKAQFQGILGINIGKNFDTPLERAVEDYNLCLVRVYPYASYIVINISSPNTPHLRQLLYGQALVELLSALKNTQAQLAAQYQKYVPLVVKISPDLTDAEIAHIAQICLEQRIDGLIATNTTISREGLTDSVHANESGGLSGEPLFQQSQAVVAKLHHYLQGNIPIIACGGIMNAADAATMLQAGASLVQIYTGLIYKGPRLIKESVKHSHAT
jgi:dihydroorotate dehydrogenase